MTHRNVLAAMILLAMTGCQSDPGQQAQAESRLKQTASLMPADLAARLEGFEEGRWTLEMAGPLTCGVDVYHFEYDTVGGRGEKVTASSALMVPRGEDETCKGPSPVVMGFHGTMPDRPYNLADLSGTNPASGRALAWAGVYAARGYIVIAPNYSGLDTSDSPYQSYHHADQQTQDVIDALAAARKLMADVSAQASDRLFLVGYSQGGWLAMATHRELEARDTPPTASVPMSGVYGLSALVDNVFRGSPVRGSTLYFPLAIRSFQEAYGNIYTDPAEVYNPALAETVATLLPSDVPHYRLIADGLLPASNLFNDAPDLSGMDLSPWVAGIMETGSPATTPEAFAEIYASGFGSDYLLNDQFRIAYLKDIETNPDGGFPDYTTGRPPEASSVGLRQAAILNDLRNWTPTAPMMMCGGPGDGAAEFRFGAQLMMQYWSDPAHAPQPGVVTLLDFESEIHEDDPYAGLKRDFLARRDGIETGQAWPAWVDPYHQIVLPRYCYLAARDYFDTMR